MSHVLHDPSGFSISVLKSQKSATNRLYWSSDTFTFGADKSKAAVLGVTDGWGVSASSWATGAVGAVESAD